MRNSVVIMIISFFILVCVGGWVKAARESSQVTLLENQMSELEKKSEEQTRRFEDQSIRAKEEFKKSQQISDDIMLASVSKNCKKAMAWAIQSAKGF